MSHTDDRKVSLRRETCIKEAPTYLSCWEGCKDDVLLAILVGGHDLPCA